MSALLSGAISFALGCYALASVLVMVRLVRGPRAQDRVFALDLLYLHAMLGDPSRALRDAAANRGSISWSSALSEAWLAAV